MSLWITASGAPTAPPFPTGWSRMIWNEIPPVRAPILLCRVVASYSDVPVCKKINMSHTHTEQDPRHRHTHTTRTTPHTPKRTPPTNTSQRSKVARRRCE